VSRQRAGTSGITSPSYRATGAWLNENSWMGVLTSPCSESLTWKLTCMLVVSGSYSAYHSVRTGTSGWVNRTTA
jgi:hypothetical protein